MKSLLILGFIYLIACCSHAQIKDFPDHSAEVKQFFDDLNGVDLDNKMYIIEAITHLAPDKPLAYYTIGLIYTHAFKVQYRNEKFEVDFTYFNKAKSSFQKALEIDSSCYLATYGLGQLYFRKAELYFKYFGITDSKESYRRYAEINEIVKKDLLEALPYFQEAEKLNPNHIPTLNALCETYARQNKFEIVSEFKNRIQHIQDGGKVENSFFEEYQSN